MAEPYRWVELSPMKHARSGARAHLLPDGTVLVVGGSCWSHEERQELRPGPERYDVRHDRWESAPRTSAPAPADPPALPGGVRLKHPRTDPEVTALGGGRLLVTGGYQTFSTWDGDDKNDSVEQAELVDVRRGTTREAGTVRYARHRHTAVPLPGGAVLLLGGVHDDDSASTATVELGLPRGVEPAGLFAPEVAARVEAQLSQQDFARALERTRALAKKKPARALAPARALTRRWPGEDDAWSTLGEVLLALGRTADARDAFEEAVRLDPDSPFEVYRLADALQKLGDVPRALAAYEKVVALTEEDDTWTWSVRRAALAQRQFLALRSGDPAALAREAESGTAHLADSPGWNNRCAVLLELGRFDAALEAVDRALNLDAKNAFAWGNRATVLLRLARPKEAKKACRKAIDLAAGDDALRARTFVTLGIAEYELGHFGPSVEAYDAALALADSPQAWNNRGNSLARLGQLDAALESYRRAPAFANTWWGRASVHLRRGEQQKAQAAVEQALALAPQLLEQLRADPDLRGLRLEPA